MLTSEEGYLFRCGGSNQLLKARILAEGTKHWIQPEQRRSQRRVGGQRRFVRDRKQLSQRGDRSIDIADASCHAREDFQWPGTCKRIFLDRTQRHCTFCQSQRSIIVTESHVCKSENA